MKQYKRHRQSIRVIRKNMTLEYDTWWYLDLPCLKTLIPPNDPGSEPWAVYYLSFETEEVVRDTMQELTDKSNEHEYYFERAEFLKWMARAFSALDGGGFGIFSPLVWPV